MIVQAHRKVLIPMRSVIHEASTIAKAIEQGWIKAGKPKDFTVKIIEEPQKNFFGLTSKNAKIGILRLEDITILLMLAGILITQV